VIYWPQSVTYWISHGPAADPSKTKIEIQLPDALPPLNFK
jgi:hypothetical protein